MSLHQRPHQKPAAGRRRLPPRPPPPPSPPPPPPPPPPRHRPIPPAPPPHDPLPLLPPRAPPVRRPPPTLGTWGPIRTSSVPASRWRAYTLQEAAAFAAANGTVLLAAVSGPVDLSPFLSNWLISVRRADQVLVIAEDYETLDRINAAPPPPPPPPPPPSHPALRPPASLDPRCQIPPSQLLDEIPSCE
ncbi:hypothetical protein PVAP13_1NG484919 [Panicum virgatum]|uniref:Uncharacterized protein n=1 Tax=Panicum virgatum TaxID=38727 RepID=A0A8T0X929_PANVG|nr:hypothetical protein PVAP13_1NG484919 [Panicum virgatum]